MFVTLACNGDSPAAMSAGYEISDVIPPAVPTAPASAPAPTSMAASETVITALAKTREDRGEPPTRRGHCAEVTTSRSSPMSSAATEWVRAPIDMRSGPAAA